MMIHGEYLDVASYYSESAMHDFLEKSPTLRILIDEPIKGEFTS